MRFERLRPTILSLLTLCASSTIAAGQLPALWGSVELGPLLRSVSGYVSGGNNLDLRAAVGARIVGRYGVELNGAEAVGTGYKTTDVCYFVIGGPSGCITYNPFSIAGMGGSATYGWVADDHRRLVHVSLGAGGYALSSHTSNARGMRVLGIEAGGDVAGGFRHAGLTLGVHPVFLPSVRGKGEWYIPFEGGIAVW